MQRDMSGSSWSLSLGCWSGVHVRLHVTLPLLVLCALLMSELSIYRRASFPIERVAFIVLLGLVAVATHAVSHVLSAARHGIETKELVLAPWGEWSAVESPPTAEAALNMHLAGVMANAFVCALTAMVLWLAGDTSISEMLVPLDSRLLLQEGNQLLLLRWMFCMNYCLVLMNLIPAAPFDGSRILRSILHLTLPHLNDGSIRQAVAVTGRIVGVLLVAVAIWLGPGDARGLLPAWFPLTVLGLIALFAAESPSVGPSPARQETPPPAASLLEEETHDDSAAPADFLDWEDGPFAQWLQEKRESERTRRQERADAELSDERRVDEILARLHERGPQALSAEDRKVLERVSDRLRRRQQKKS